MFSVCTLDPGNRCLSEWGREKQCMLYGQVSLTHRQKISVYSALYEVDRGRAVVTLRWQI